MTTVDLLAIRLSPWREPCSFCQSRDERIAVLRRERFTEAEPFGAASEHAICASCVERLRALLLPNTTIDGLRNEVERAHENAERLIESMRSSLAEARSRVATCDALHVGANWTQPAHVAQLAQAYLDAARTYRDAAALARALHAEGHPEHAARVEELVRAAGEDMRAADPQTHARPRKTKL